MNLGSCILLTNSSLMLLGKSDGTHIVTFYHKRQTGLNTLQSSEASRLRDFKQAGINRLSLGVQSFNDTDLKLMGKLPAL